METNEAIFSRRSIRKYSVNLFLKH